ncbi:MAG: YqeG family HAD IIIA-type phosphatase [Ruminococcaceae bacterium]|nr:YqeG family HAD IIIA-type phosphatase [Oscillospiraceae bacterium]
MVKKLVPDKTVDTVFEVTPELVRACGGKMVIFDIDNTLVSHDTPHPTPEICTFLKKFEQEGIKIALVSNNSKVRVSLFNQSLGLPASHRSAKPFKFALKRAARRAGVSAEEVVLVGDQLFTDIWGGNRMGFTTVLVTPIKRDETRFVSLKRRFEEKIIGKDEKKG